MKGLTVTLCYLQPLLLLSFLLPFTFIVVSAKPENNTDTVSPIGWRIASGASSSPANDTNGSPSRRRSSTPSPTSMLPGNGSSPLLASAVDNSSQRPTESRRSRSTTASVATSATSGRPATLQPSSAVAATAIASADERRAAASSAPTPTQRSGKLSGKCAAQCNEDYKLCLLSGRPKRSLDATHGSDDRTKRSATAVRRQAASPKTCKQKYVACMNSCSNRRRKTSQRTGS